MLEYATLAWNVVGTTIALCAAHSAEACTMAVAEQKLLAVVYSEAKNRRPFTCPGGSRPDGAPKRTRWREVVRPAQHSRLRAGTHATPRYGRQPRTRLLRRLPACRRSDERLQVAPPRSEGSPLFIKEGIAAVDRRHG